jgi:sugar lactone lactonase YvrE
MRFSLYAKVLFAFSFLSCHYNKTSDENQNTARADKPLPYFTYHRENVFPGDSSLLRAEDGIALKDGRILVVDQAKGLRLIEKDGHSRPFGHFETVGYVYHPPQLIPSPNGVALEPDGKNLLMVDLTDGKIYRINLETEGVEIIYDHPYGLNAVYEDKTGAIWFTQSANNTTVAELVSELNQPVPHGAVFRMANLKSPPVKIIDSLYFANGLTMDKEEKHLYVSETMMDRVHAYDVDISNGTAKYNGVAANVMWPDNLLVTQDGRLFVASTFSNEIIAVDFKTHSQQIIFDGSTRENIKITNEMNRRNHLGLERLKFASAGAFSPLPGGLTGMFFSLDSQTLYITNLGKDLLKYNW